MPEVQEHSRNTSNIILNSYIISCTLVILHNYKDHQIRLTNGNAQLLAHMPFNA